MTITGQTIAPGTQIIKAVDNSDSTFTLTLSIKPTGDINDDLGSLTGSLNAQLYVARNLDAQGNLVQVLDSTGAAIPVRFDNDGIRATNESNESFDYLYATTSTIKLCDPTEDNCNLNLETEGTIKAGTLDVSNIRINGDPVNDPRDTNVTLEASDLRILAKLTVDESDINKLSYLGNANPQSEIGAAVGLAKVAPEAINAVDANNNNATVTITQREFGALNGIVDSNTKTIAGQLDEKQVDLGLTNDATSSANVTQADFEALSGVGVKGNIQAQLNGKELNITQTVGLTRTAVTDANNNPGIKLEVNTDLSHVTGVGTIKSGIWQSATQKIQDAYIAGTSKWDFKANQFNVGPGLNLSNGTNASDDSTGTKGLLKLKLEGSIGTDNTSGDLIVKDKSVTNNMLINDSITLGGVPVTLGGTYATPAFDLSNAKNYPASKLTGSLSMARIDGGAITDNKLAEDYIKRTEIDANTLGFASNKLTIQDNAIATSKIQNSAVTKAKISNDVAGIGLKRDTDGSLALDLAANSEFGLNASNQLKIENGKVTNNMLANPSFILGGVTVALGGTYATPEFNLTKAKNYPASKLDGTLLMTTIADGSITDAKLESNFLKQTNIADSTFEMINNNGNDELTIKNDSVGKDKLVVSDIAGKGLTMNQQDRTLELKLGAGLEFNANTGNLDVTAVASLPLIDGAQKGVIKPGKAVIYSDQGHVVTDKINPGGNNTTIQIFNKGNSQGDNTLNVYGDVEISNDMSCNDLVSGGNVEVLGKLTSQNLQIDGDVTIGEFSDNNSVDHSKTSTVKVVSNKIILKSHAEGADKKIHLDTTILDIGNKGTETNTTLYGELEVAGDIGCNDLIVGDNLEIGNNVYIENDLTIGDADDKTSKQTIYGGLDIIGVANSEIKLNSEKLSFFGVDAIKQKTSTKAEVAAGAGGEVKTQTTFKHSQGGNKHYTIQQILEALIDYGLLEK